MLNPILALMLSQPAIFAPFEISKFLEQTAYSGYTRMDQMKQLIVQIAKQYGINPNWVLAIILKESSGLQYHIRYEPNYKDLYHPEVFSKSLHITLETETESQKISWGLGQLMGALLREQGHAGLMAEAVDPSLNIKHICIRLRNLKKYSQNPSDIFAMYNGGPGIMSRKVNGKFPNEVYVDGVWTLVQNHLMIDK